MELKQARLIAMLVVALVSGCAQMPGPDTSRADRAPEHQAPERIEEASERLDELPEPVRTDTALEWARAYLRDDRADAAGELLDRMDGGARSQDQRYRWVRLRAQVWLAERRPGRALAFLDDQGDFIDGLDGPRRARLELLNADALALDGEAMRSLRERVAVDPMLEDDDQDYNRDLTWRAIMDLPLETLEDEAGAASGDLRGWLELGLIHRDPQANMDNQMRRLERWRDDWRDHPAADQLPDMMEALEKAVRERPERVAVLLPESGNLKRAGEAIRDGFMTGYYSAEEEGNPTPDLRFYDVGDGDVRDVYERAVEDGAEFVVGPLAKDEVAELARVRDPDVTILALNYLDQGSEDAPLYQFGLAPEDEARQIARQRLRRGDHRAGVLYPRSEWGRRVSQAFIRAWEDGGGTVSAERSFSEDDIGETVESMLDEADSRARDEGYTGNRFSDQDEDRDEDQGRQRRGMDFLFLVADPNEGRQIKPALNFHYAQDLPVYATSYIYSGETSPRQDQDLDNVLFLDMPWILYQDSKLHQRAQENWPDGHGRYERLFAMGVDAYRLQGRLYLLNNFPDSQLPGITGTLRLDGSRVVRELNWAVFRHGKPTPLPQVSGEPVEQTTILE